MGPCPTEEMEKYGTAEAWLEALGLTPAEIEEALEDEPEDERWVIAELIAYQAKVDAQRDARKKRHQDRLAWLHLPYPHRPRPALPRLRRPPAPLNLRGRYVPLITRGRGYGC